MINNEKIYLYIHKKRVTVGHTLVCLLSACLKSYLTMIILGQVLENVQVLKFYTAVFCQPVKCNKETVEYYKTFLTSELERDSWSDWCMR